jgi:RNA polymerase primary sigma factor
MITESGHDFLHYYPHVDTVDVQTEQKLAVKMDQALSKLMAAVFDSDAHLSNIVDIMLEQWPYDKQVDEINTLVDYAGLVRAYPDLFDDSYDELKLKIATYLTQSIHDRSMVFDTVFSVIDTYHPPSSDIVRFHNQYLKSRNQLVQANMRLVIHLARRYGGKGVELQELVQDGTLGLIKASERYNFNKGFRFTTYAYWWIQQAIKESLSDKRGVVRLPNNINERILKIDRVKQDFFKSHGCYPSRSEIQSLTGLDSKHIEAVEGIGNLADSLHEPVFDEGLSLEEVHSKEDTLENPSEHHDIQMNQNFVEAIIEKLPERQQFIIRLYHGIGISQTFPFKEIAPQLGITLERTRQLYHESIRALKELVKE